MSEDRRVHAIIRDGSEIVCYSCDGKWYVQSSEGRTYGPFAEAVASAVQEAARAVLGLPGGTRFDAVRPWR